MLEYDKIDISEGIDTKKTGASKECYICHYWYFLNKNMSGENKKRLKEYQKKLSLGLKTCFTDANMSVKRVANIFFVCSFISFYKKMVF